MDKKKILLLIIGVGLLLYFNSFFNSFVCDDEEQIVNNQLVYSLKNIPVFFKGSTFNTGGSGSLAGIYYKPLMSVSFSILYSLFGPRPFFFHAFQLLFHLANAILVFYILKKIVDDEILALLMSLIFLVHPMNTEAVIYIAALQDVLFFFFGILALLIVVYKKNLSLKNFLCVFLLLVFSLLSKETGILFIPLTLTYLILYKREQILSFLSLFVFVIGLYCILRFAVANIGLERVGISPISKADLFTRIITIPKTIFYYLKTFLFPSYLSILQHWIVRKIDFSNFFVPLFIDFVFLLSLLVVILKTKNKGLIFFALWLIFSIFFHLNLFPLDMTVAERWFYFPMVALLGIVGIILRYVKFKKINLRVIFIFVVCALFIRTFFRIFDWRNGLALYGHDYKINNQAFDLVNNYGIELYRHNRIGESKKYFLRSVELAPYWWTNWNSLGVVEEWEGDLKTAENYYLKSMANGNYYIAYQNYARLLLQQYRFVEAQDFLMKNALLKFPKNAKLIKLYQMIPN